MHDISSRSAVVNQDLWNSNWSLKEKCKSNVRVMARVELSVPAEAQDGLRCGVEAADHSQ